MPPTRCSDPATRRRGAPRMRKRWPPCTSASPAIRTSPRSTRSRCWAPWRAAWPARPMLTKAHSAALAGSATQTRVTAILDQVLRAHPNHPGALHYLLHNHDDPAHARAALPAARAYAKVAPASSHALHMPAHIFLQLGMWHDAAQADRAAYDASDAWVKAKRLAADDAQLSRTVVAPVRTAATGTPHRGARHHGANRTGRESERRTASA